MAEQMNKKQKDAAWYAANREKKLLANRLYKQANKEAEKQRCKAWEEAHKEHITTRKRIHRHSSAFNMLRHNIKGLINNAINNRGFIKSSHTRDLLGCSYEALLSHLGPKPTPDAHIDHICPCNQSVNEQELLKLQHYTNLRWMPSTDNLLKSDQWTPEGEALCKSLLGREWIHHKGRMKDGLTPLPGEDDVIDGETQETSDGRYRDDDQSGC